VAGITPLIVKGKARFLDHIADEIRAICEAPKRGVGLRDAGEADPRALLRRGRRKGLAGGGS
jgi:hypothetical protein